MATASGGLTLLAVLEVTNTTLSRTTIGTSSALAYTCPAGRFAEVYPFALGIQVLEEDDPSPAAGYAQIEVQGLLAFQTASVSAANGLYYTTPYIVPTGVLRSSGDTQAGFLPLVPYIITANRTIDINLVQLNGTLTTSLIAIFKVFEYAAP